MPLTLQKNYLWLLGIFLLTSNLLIAQKNTHQVYGKVMDKTSGDPIEFATILIKDFKTQKPITGTTTSKDGTFSITIDSANVSLYISFIGYEAYNKTDVQLTSGKNNLGTILLLQNSAQLNELVVSGEKSTIEFKLDKRVFNVGKDIGSTGASALEVLNHVPSVNVNIEGEISLRGSGGVQILIDGKPSVLAEQGSNALGAITADMIDKIEVITNPSAKYDAEGTSGIINIVMKKEEKKGLNGSITINTGIPDNHSLGISLNRRTEKFNLFTQIGAGYRSLPRDEQNINQNTTENTKLMNKGHSFRNETFYNLILGADYHINANNTLTLSGNYALEIEDQPSNTDFALYQHTVLISSWNRTETTEAINPKWQYELSYKKQFTDYKDHTFLFSTLGKFFGKDQSSYFSTKNTFGSDLYDDQKTETKFEQADYTFNADYTHPFSEKIALEAGAQYVINNVGNDYAVYDLLNTQWVPNQGLINQFNYDQKVLGVYSTGSYQGKRYGIKLGMRMENTNLQTLLALTSQANSQNYLDWFPSAHTSYKFSKTVSLQGGYSRRIYRPRLWDLNPFFNIRNNFNIRSGNPNLKPEYTDSYELTSIFIFEKTTINTGIYYRYTTDVVERVSIYANNVNTTLPLNIGTDNITGFELNAKYSPIKWCTFNVDFNYSYFRRKGQFEGSIFDFNGDKWTSKLMATFKLPKEFDVECTGNYQSEYRTVQSKVSETAFLDLGLRKKILKGKVVASIGVRDVFASRIMESNITQTDYYLYSHSKQGRFITFGLSYGFGKGEAMVYSGARRH